MIIAGKLKTNPKTGMYCTRLSYLDENGERKQPRHEFNIRDIPGNKKKAEEALADLKNEVAKSLERKKRSIIEFDSCFDSNMLFSDYLVSWLKGRTGEIEQSTYESYEGILKIHLVPFFSKLKVTLDGLNWQHIKQYITNKKTSGVKRLSDETIKKHKRVISAALETAVDDDLIESNPAKKKKLDKMLRPTKYNADIYTPEQIKELQELSEGKPLYTAISIVATYALRRGEFNGLKWCAVDFANDKITFSHTVTRHKSKIAKDYTKSGTTRTLDLTPKVRKHLLELRDEQAKNKEFWGDAYNDSDYILRKNDGSEYAVEYVSKEFSKLLEKNNLPHIRFHDLRHSTASYLLSSGVDIKTVQEILGHSTPATTLNYYAHSRSETKTRAVIMMEEALF